MGSEKVITTNRRRDERRTNEQKYNRGTLKSLGIFAREWRNIDIGAGRCRDKARQSTIERLRRKLELRYFCRKKFQSLSKTGRRKKLTRDKKWLHYEQSGLSMSAAEITLAEQYKTLLRFLPLLIWIGLLYFKIPHSRKGPWPLD